MDGSPAPSSNRVSVRIRRKRGEIVVCVRKAFFFLKNSRLIFETAGEDKKGGGGGGRERERERERDDCASEKMMQKAIHLLFFEARSSAAAAASLQ